jgi:hypothetical protein
MLTRTATAAITNFHSNDADNLMMALHHWVLQQMPKRNVFISIANFSIPRNPKDTKKKVKSVMDLLACKTPPPLF